MLKKRCLNRLRSLLIVPIVVLVFGACQLAPRGVSPIPSSAANFNANSPGQLAYISGDGNVYVVPADLSRKTRITGDATTSREGAGLSYQRLAWSPTGQLAYAAVTRTRDNAASTLYVKDSLTDPPKIVEQSDEHFVIYIYWSPVACADQPGCHRLAYLIEEAEDIGLHFVQITDQAISNQIIGFGWPYYFSWSADGQSIVWHTGGGYQENPAAELALYDLAEAKTHRFPHQPAGFLAPAWSPRDNIWIGATISKGDAMLRQFSPESTTA
ncbi:MAG: hypothetical protein R3264_16745, partial [Anaerolineae bacterium]|nr:hypothetical protein [Anaerolineae bacterium]